MPGPVLGGEGNETLVLLLLLQNSPAVEREVGASGLGKEPVLG